MSTFLNFFKQPKSDYDDLYDQARFKLTWRVNIAILYAVLVFMAITTLMAPTYFPVILVALIFSTTVVVVLRTTRKYELAAKLFLILAIIISTSQLFLVQDMIHLVDLVWYITEVIFAYFVLGKKWGTFGLVSFTISLICYIFFTFDTNISVSYTHLTLPTTPYV